VDISVAIVCMVVIWSLVTDSEATICQNYVIFCEHSLMKFIVSSILRL